MLVLDTLRFLSSPPWRSWRWLFKQLGFQKMVWKKKMINHTGDKVNLLIIIQWFYNLKLDFSAIMVRGKEIWLFENHWETVAFYFHCFWVFFWFQYWMKCFSILQLWYTHWWLYRQIIWQSHNPSLKCENLSEFCKIFMQVMQQKKNPVAVKDLLWWSSQTVESVPLALPFLCCQREGERAVV